jgi:hypothetical protein
MSKFIQEELGSFSSPVGELFSRVSWSQRGDDINCAFPREAYNEEHFLNFRPGKLYL